MKTFSELMAMQEVKDFLARAERHKGRNLNTYVGDGWEYGIHADTVSGAVYFRHMKSGAVIAA